MMPCSNLWPRIQSEPWQNCILRCVITQPQIEKIFAPATTLWDGGVQGISGAFQL